MLINHYVLISLYKDMNHSLLSVASEMVGGTNYNYYIYISNLKF